LPRIATITHKQAKRAIKKGGYALLVLVKEAASDPPPTATPSKLQQLQHEFSDVFIQELSGPPPHMPEVEVEAIRLKDENIKYRPMPRYSMKETECIRNEIQTLLSKDLIQPSSSPFGAPVLFVKKKDGGLRMVIDYRATNAKTIRNQYPLPRIDDLVDQLLGSSYWSALDLTSGYHQLRLVESDVPRTSFKMPYGLYEFKVLSFGLTNAPAVLSQMMNNVFQAYIGKFVLIYLDDILVYSKSEEEHSEHLRLVFHLLRTHQLHLKPSKCQFFKSDVTYLGHVISAEGIKPDPAKTASVEN
jgi:hypothetical protein